MSRYRHSIYWQDANPVPAGPPLDTDVRCDVCVVGAGFTGLWTAHFLRAAAPELDVQVVERGVAGAAASGTADGFVTPTVGTDLAHLIERCGRERSAVICDLTARSVLELDRFVRAHRIDAEWEQNDHLLVATDDAQIARLERHRRLAAYLGPRFDVTVLRGATARQWTSAPEIKAAVRTSGALVNPFKLARGLVDVIRHAGVPVHEHSPAVRITPVPGGHRVSTPGGSVTARHVVLATSAHQHTLTGFRRSVLPMWSYVLVSEPLTDRQRDRVFWPGREGLVEATTFLHRARLTADSRIMWAGGAVRYFPRRDMRIGRMHGATAYRELRRSFKRSFPMWSDVRFQYAYGGCVDVTRDLVPHFGSHRPGVWHGYGYCGNGIAAAHLGGKVLRDLVLGRETEYSALPLVDGREPPFPPEPFAFCGARAATRLVRWRESRP